MHNRKRHVLLTAQRLFIEKGFTATSVQDIIDESQISKGTFYNYFASKNECLIAILEVAQNEAIVRRKELLVGQNLLDQRILEKQIAIRFELNREHNLLPLFEAIIHSGEKELREFVKHYHLQELSWLSSRLVDVYGQEAEPHAVDCAIIFLGTIQHLLHVSSGHLNNKIQPAPLISFAMKRLDSIMKDLIDSGDVLFQNTIFVSILEKPPVKEELLKELAVLNHSLRENDEANEYLQFIIAEVHENNPRKHILNTVLLSLRKEVVEVNNKNEALTIISKVSQYVDHL